MPEDVAISRARQPSEPGERAADRPRVAAGAQAPDPGEVETGEDERERAEDEVEPGLR